MKLFLSLLCSFVLALNLSAQENGTVTIYQDANFGGAFYKIENDWQAKDVHAIWDGQISAIRIPEGTNVIIYENSDFSGAHRVLYGDWQAIDDDIDWDNEVSAIRFFDTSKPYGMIYHCYLQEGTKDLWSRTNDFVLNDNSKTFFGLNQVTNVVVDTVDLSLTFDVDDAKITKVKITIDGNDLFGWVQHKSGVRQSLYGLLKDLHPDNYTPKQAQSVIKDRPSPKVKKEENSAVYAANQFPAINYSEGVKVYKSTNFTGESRYVDEDWSFGDIVNDDDFFDWWRQIRSIRVPLGWAIVCYDSENFKGNSIEITADWVPANNPNWNERIRSIRILRKGIVDYWGNLLNPAVTVYKTLNFTGESRYVDSDWSFGDVVKDDDFFDWWRQIKSIRVPRGWAIICYEDQDFKGDSIQITGDWVPGKDPKWNERIKSIQIVRSNGF